MVSSDGIEFFFLSNTVSTVLFNRTTRVSGNVCENKIVERKWFVISKIGGYATSLVGKFL